MSDIQELKKQREDINKKIEAENRKREKVLLAESQALIGTCYIFKNSYGGGDTFTSYFQIQKIDRVWVTSFGNEDIQVSGIQINDHKSEFGIEAEHSSLSIWADNPIPYKVFLNAYNRVLKKLQPV